MVSKLTAASLAALLCTAALAAGRTLPAPDLDGYARLRDARALADARQQLPGARSQRTGADAEFQKALQAAGWTSARYQAADAIVSDALAYLQGAGDNPAQAEEFWEANERVDAATVALVKARRPQLEAAEERARQALRQEQEVSILGRLATRADLQGTWQRDREASRAHLASALHMGAAQVSEILKDQGESWFTFSGDQAEGREVRAGVTSTWKAPYRIEGRNLVFLTKGREERLQVGVRSPTELIFGAMGIPSGVYRKR
jgi:hypothetical protein